MENCIVVLSTEINIFVGTNLLHSSVGLLNNVPNIKHLIVHVLDSHSQRCHATARCTYHSVTVKRNFYTLNCNKSFWNRNL